MSDFNPREPIRLSDIDNLLEDSIFNSSNGAKLAEYLKKKRGGGGRVRLHNIFEQVAANMPKPTFNFDMDSSEPNPLPDSPQIAEQSEPGPVPTTSAGPVQNGNVIVEALASAPPTEPPVVVAVPDARPASPKTIGKSPGPLANLGRQALLNQYHRTNMAKCELLKQITSSTPKPEANGSMSRISAFTTSISPIIESSSSPVTVAQQVAAPQPVVNPTPISSILPVESVPPTQQVLAPCSQAPPTSTPQKVVIIGTPVEPGPPAPDMVIPETPSPVKISSDSPKVAHQIQPRKLTDTFNQLQNDMANASNENENITSDESGSIEEEHPVVPKVAHVPPVETSIMRKSILKDADASSLNRRVSLRVSFSQQLVQEREISPAPSIPEAHYSSSSDDDDDDDSSDSSDEEYQVVDEVYSDDGAECDPNDIHENYQELIGSRECLDKQVLEIPERIPSPLINVVDEAPVRWYETTTPRVQKNNDGLALAPVTCAKENKTNLQLVDIITDWDEEDDDEEEEERDKEEERYEVQERDKEEERDKQEEGDKEEEQQKSPEKEPSAMEIPETQRLTQHTNETICETMDITNVEDSAERLVELPPPLVSFNGSAQEEPQLGTPERPLTPPSQFTDSAKKRFLRENDEALLSRLQNELPVSQQEEVSPGTPELVSDTLVEILHSFRDQPVPKPIADECRKTVVPARRGRRTKSAVDPATTTYFETVEKTFVKPIAPTNKSVPVKPLTTAQKRKLYATTKQTKSPERLTRNSVDRLTSRIRNLNIVIRRLEVDIFLQRLTDADRAILEGTTKAPRKKPMPNLKKGKKISKKNRIAIENGNGQEPQLEASEGGTGSDSNEPIFTGFAENEKNQSAPEEVEKLLNGPNDPLETNDAAK
ncbi:uncharacterized protein LOC134283949, partial [Aedes albopictus]|uniref:Microtubule-associated protein futsch n=1 Tax=Aedes albopictus TaxID=7160 RepID=A0ABM1Z436_AEDAL